MNFKFTYLITDPEIDILKKYLHFTLLYIFQNSNVFKGLNLLDTTLHLRAQFSIHISLHVNNYISLVM